MDPPLTKHSLLSFDQGEYYWKSILPFGQILFFLFFFCFFLGHQKKRMGSSEKKSLRYSVIVIVYGRTNAKGWGFYNREGIRKSIFDQKKLWEKSKINKKKNGAVVRPRQGGIFHETQGWSLDFNNPTANCRKSGSIHMPCFEYDISHGLYAWGTWPSHSALKFKRTWWVDHWWLLPPRTNFSWPVNQ